MLKKPIYIFVLFISIVFPLKKTFSQKTDTIYHVNGNILTGELKSLTYGVVTWKMDGMGTISLEEIKINTIISKKQFEIKMKNDIVYFGSFSASTKNRTIYIVTNDKKELVNVEDIVELYPIKKSVWLRMSGSFSLGLNYSKGSGVGTLALSGNLDYRKEVSYFDLTWNANNTYQMDSLTTTKYDFGLAWQRTLKKGWYAQTAISGNQNSELGTKLRWELDLMGLKDLSYNNWNRLYVGGGLSAIREIPYGDGVSQNDLAGIAQVVWKVYKLTSPKVWVDANISYLPYLTDNRYRTVFNLNPKISVLSDNFKVGFTFYYNYDSSPTANAFSSDDYGLNLQLSYALHP